MEKKSSISKLRILLLIVLYFYHCDGEGCSSKSELNYIHSDYVHTKVLQTETGITNGSPMVKHFLKTCLFQDSPYSAAICGYQCNKHADCLAHEVGSVNKCELCLRNVDSGRKETKKDALVYIRLAMLEEYIDGTFNMLS